MLGLREPVEDYRCGSLLVIRLKIKHTFPFLLVSLRCHYMGKVAIRYIHSSSSKFLQGQQGPRRTNNKVVKYGRKEIIALQ